MAEIINRSIKHASDSSCCLHFWVLQQIQTTPLLHGHGPHGKPFFQCLVFSPTPNPCFFPFSTKHYDREGKQFIPPILKPYLNLARWPQLEDLFSNLNRHIQNLQLQLGCQGRKSILATAAKVEAEQIRTAGPLDQEIGWIPRSRRETNYELNSESDKELRNKLTNY